MVGIMGGIFQAVISESDYEGSHRMKQITAIRNYATSIANYYARLLDGEENVMPESVADGEGEEDVSNQ